MATILSITVVSWQDFVKKFSDNEVHETLFLPAVAFKSMEKIQAGAPFEIRVRILEDSSEDFLKGEIAWVRTKPIKLPGKFIPAGVSIALNQESQTKLSSVVIASDSYLEEVEDLNMVGGNYIKVRKDIAGKYHKKKETTGQKVPTEEQRAMPRIQIRIAVDLFVQDNIHHLVSRDISLGGLSVETEELFDIAEEVLMIFEDSGVHKEFIIKGHIVRHINSADTMKKGVGIKFDFENVAQRKKLMSFIVRES